MWDHEIIPVQGSGRQMTGSGQGKDAVLADPAHYPVSAVCGATVAASGQPGGQCAQLVECRQADGEWYHVVPRFAGSDEEAA